MKFFFASVANEEIEEIFLEDVLFLFTRLKRLSVFVKIEVFLAIAAKVW